MTAIGKHVAPIKRPGELGVHSVDRFVFTVPDLPRLEPPTVRFDPIALRPGPRIYAQLPLVKPRPGAKIGIGDCVNPATASKKTGAAASIVLRENAATKSQRIG